MDQVFIAAWGKAKIPDKRRHSKPVRPYHQRGNGNDKPFERAFPVKTAAEQFKQGFYFFQQCSMAAWAGLVYGCFSLDAISSSSAERASISL